MPRYVAFLRAINLGATRKFPKDAIRACVEETGATEVATHINTGNVLLTSGRRSAGAVEKDLEQAFAADRDFEVPTIAYGWADFAALAAETDEWAPGEGVRHYVTLLKQPPADRDALSTLDFSGESARLSEAVDARAVHVFIEGDYHTAKLSNATLERRLGIATTRDAKVIRALGTKWAP